jgi:hypothetical protein
VTARRYDLDDLDDLDRESMPSGQLVRNKQLAKSLPDHMQRRPACAKQITDPSVLEYSSLEWEWRGVLATRQLQGSALSGTSSFNQNVL